MKKSTLAFLFVLFLAAIPARSADAHADVSTYRVKNKTLDARFFSAPTDCEGVDTIVRYNELVERIDGPPTVTPPSASVELTYSNFCTGESFVLQGGVDPQKVTFTPDLSRATLKARIPVSDGITSAIVKIDLTWTANAPLQQVKDSNVAWDPVARTITWDRRDLRAQTADVDGVASTVLLDQLGPTPIDLTEFPVSGLVGRNVLSTKTVTFLRR